MREIAGHNTRIGEGDWLVRRFAKLAFLAVIMSVVAVPVTCVDAHGPHSLYAPPDAQASTPAATLATLHDQHGHAQHQGAVEPPSVNAGGAAQQVATIETDGPVMTSVNVGFLLLDQQATEPVSVEFTAKGHDLRELAQPVLTAPESRQDAPEAPPPR